MRELEPELSSDSDSSEKMSEEPEEETSGEMGKMSERSGEEIYGEVDKRMGEPTGLVAQEKRSILRRLFCTLPRFFFQNYHCFSTCFVTILVLLRPVCDRNTRSESAMCCV